MTQKKKVKPGIFHTSDGNGGFYIDKGKLQVFYTIIGLLVIFSSIISWAVSAQVSGEGKDGVQDTKIEALNNEIETVEGTLVRMEDKIDDINSYLRTNGK